ncbi:MAG: hypothetical protein IAF08_02680 [Rhizobacter sp.]|nr:hypothetical protein [Chlorobiales bacterium]
MLAELEIKQSEHRTAEEKRTSAQLATGYLNHALAAAEGNHSQEVACRAYKTYADAYRLAGDYERALEQYEKFHELQRKIFAQEIQQKAKILQARFETEKAKKEADLQQAKAEAEHLRNMELAGVNQQLEESNRRLTEADQLKTDLLGIAAHDLKNPLQSILGFAELISARTAGDAKVAGYAKTIEQTAVRMFKTVVDLLQSSAIDSGVIVLQREIIDVTDLIAYIAESNMIHAAKKDQRIDFPPQQICVVNADAERLHEVIDNLIGNAIKFSPRGKTIWVKVEKRDEKVCVSVRDEGLGMDAEDLKKIFGKFRKLSARPTGGENSTGLGLFIAKQLIDLHGGKIWVESKGKDQGTTFTVELPAVIS